VRSIELLKRTCLRYNPTLVLLVLVEDKTLTNITDAEAQVIAEAIAAFQPNNGKYGEHGLDSLDAMTSLASQ
jgi:hypothetical protein